ncbi:MAG: cell division protein ZipA [Cellvibrionaceae bacterium]|nr:cell division protein ZipA [Cellvibrionaceae bacterium]
MTQEWLTLIIVLLIVAIIADGIRRMRNAKRDSLKMSLRSGPADADDSDGGDTDYGSEFPNGGARPSQRQIDSDRIKKVRSKYNFGDDIPNWRQHLSRKNPLPADKIEPSVSEIDPLLDEVERPADPVDEHSAPDAPVTAADAARPGGASGYFADAEQLLDTLADDGAAAATPVQAHLDLAQEVPMLMDALDAEPVHSAEGDTVSDADSGAARDTIQTVAKPADTDDEGIDTYSANKPRYESKYTAHPEAVSGVSEVLVIHLRARDDELYKGEELLTLILDNGLRFGAMDIFHYHAEADGEGPIVFSMANMVKPGSFDLHSFEQFTTVGLSFFMTLPLVNGQHLAAFEQMLAIANAMAAALGGELKDEQRSVLTGQTIEHYRERIRDFSRRQQLEKNKS